MSDDKIAEIRARHMSETWPRLYELKVQIHDDREWLLAEVDRLRAEMLDLAEWCETEEPLSYKKISYRLRAALEGKP